MRHDKGDYSRAEEYLEDIAEEIEFEHGAPFQELEKETQIQALLDHFFKGIPQYRPAAVALRVGVSSVKRLSSYESIRIEMIKGHKIIRDAKTGRIKKWVK